MEIIMTLASKYQGVLLIYDFIREFYAHKLTPPTNIIGMIDAYKIYLECQNVSIESSQRSFRPILDEEVPWNHKEQVKYMSKIYARRHTYILDIVFFGKVEDEARRESLRKRPKSEICYLFLINVNTQKLYVIPINYYYDPIVRCYRKFKEPKEVTTEDVLNKLIELLTRENIQLKHLISDADRRFTASLFIEFLERYNIDHKIQQVNACYPVHSLIGILNRVVKTIRRWALWNRLDFYPETIQNLINMYNDKEHRTLSDLIGLPLSPNDVDSNYVYENILVYSIQKQNLLTTTRRG